MFKSRSLRMVAEFLTDDLTTVNDFENFVDNLKSLDDKELFDFYQIEIIDGFYNIIDE
jgi:hypothetical protein